MKYISRFKCKKINKKYVIPNINWFTALNDLDIFFNKKHDLHKLLQNEKILIKITYCRNHDLEEINKLFLGMPNLVQTFYTFYCYDNSMKINTIHSFKYPEPNNKYAKDCYHVTMELMTFYKKGNINKYIDELENDRIYDVLQQLLYCQLNIFYKFMFTHNDIKLTNIQINKHNKIKKINYKQINKKIVSKYEYILSDYDRIVSFADMYKNGLSRIFTKKEYYFFSLFNNILLTITIFNKLDCVNKDYIEYMEDNTKNNIDSYYKGKITRKKFKKLELNNNIEFVDIFLNKIENSILL